MGGYIAAAVTLRKRSRASPNDASYCGNGPAPLTWIKAAMRPTAKHGADRNERDPHVDRDVLWKAKTRTALVVRIILPVYRSAGLVLGSVATDVVRLASVPATLVK